MIEKPFVVVCIPAFNEERTIGGAVVQALRYVDRVVVCDDGSGDQTGEIAGGAVGAALDVCALKFEEITFKRSG